MADRRRGGSEEALGPFFLFSEAELLHLIILNMLGEKLKTIINRPPSVNPVRLGIKAEKHQADRPAPALRPRHTPELRASL